MSSVDTQLHAYLREIERAKQWDLHNLHPAASPCADRWVDSRATAKWMIGKLHSIGIKACVAASDRDEGVCLSVDMRQFPSSNTSPKEINMGFTTLFKLSVEPPGAGKLSGIFKEAVESQQEDLRRQQKGEVLQLLKRVEELRESAVGSIRTARKQDLLGSVRSTVRVRPSHRELSPAADVHGPQGAR